MILVIFTLGLVEGFLLYPFGFERLLGALIITALIVIKLAPGYLRQSNAPRGSA